MKTTQAFKISIIVAALIGCIPAAQAQSFNVWRGDEEAAEWNNPYKWNLKHPPAEAEAVHFREPNSKVIVNRTIDLQNGMLLYGKELTLSGAGNINLSNPVTHQRTVNIPASASGFSNLTLNDTLSLNGRIALASKAFGTSGGKGTFTLQNQTSASGTLVIGNDGCGTGKVFIRDDASYRITALELSTRASSGGSAEIHVIGGTVRLETKTNPFMPFFEDDSRKIVMGDNGSLHIETDMATDQKIQQLKAMIQHNRLIPANGCRLTPPVIDNNTILIKAEDLRNDSTIDTTEKLLAAIDQTHEELKLAEQANRQKQDAQAKLEAMMAKKAAEAAAEAAALAETEGTDEKIVMAENADNSPQPTTKAIAGYIVFLGMILLMVRRPKNKE